MKLYNARSQQVEAFPGHRRPITIYHCSKAPYPAMNLQHAFSYVVVDCLLRFLAYQGRQVTYVQDIIDLDDYILVKAAATGEQERDLRQQWIAQFIRELHALHIRPPDSHFYQEFNEQPQVAILVGSAPSTGFWLSTAIAEENHDNGKEDSHERVSPLLVSELLTTYSPDVLRFYLASHHYRHTWYFSLPMLVYAAEHVRVLKQAISAQGGWGRRFDPTPISQYVIMALDDDLNTTNALTALLFLAEEILSAAAAGQQVTVAQSLLRTLSGIFGLRLGAPMEGDVSRGWQRHSPALLASPTGIVRAAAMHPERVQPL